MTRGPTELRYNPADNAAAAALWTAADAGDHAAAAAARAGPGAECDDPGFDPRVLQAVLRAAAATARALAQTGPLGTVQAHRRGGKPPQTQSGPAPPNLKPEAHRHASAKGHCRQSHSRAVSPT